MEKTSALDLFNSLTIEEVREQIATIDGEIAVMEKKRDSLRTIEKAIDIRDNGKPKKTWSKKQKEKAAEKGSTQVEVSTETTTDSAPRGPGRQPSHDTLELRAAIYKLIRTKGPMATSEISRDLRVEYGKVKNALEGGNFEQHGKLWNIAPVT